MQHYCTYFDSNYLPKGLALYHSLVENSPEPFTLWVLCFDDRTYQSLSEMFLPNMRLISQSEFEGRDEELIKAKENRNRFEYYWTCTPSLPLYLFRHQPDILLITYLDADLYFFSDPSPIFDELGDGSIGIVPHRFPQGLSYEISKGIYNVGIMCFRRDSFGLAALCWWRDRCIEWCYFREEDGKWGDQKYLDDWTVRFKNVIVLQHKGVGLANWNVKGYTFSYRNKQVFVDDDILIVYHFHGFQMVSDYAFMHGIKGNSQGFSISFKKASFFRHVYIPYAREIIKTRLKSGIFQAEGSVFFKGIPGKKHLPGFLMGDYLLANDNFISYIITLTSLRMGDGKSLAREGYSLNKQGDHKWARKKLASAVIRSPRLLFSSTFWKALTLSIVEQPM